MATPLEMAHAAARRDRDHGSVILRNAAKELRVNPAHAGHGGLLANLLDRAAFNADEAEHHAAKNADRAQTAMHPRYQPWVADALTIAHTILAGV